MQALLALTVVSAKDAAHREKDDPPADAALGREILAALGRIEWDKLDQARQLDLVRVYQVVLHRFGLPNDALRGQLVARFDPHCPAKSRELNAELVQLLVFLDAPDAAAKTVALLDRALTQEEQIDYAAALRVLKTGWTPELHRQYAEWFAKAAGYRGGNSFRGFMNQIKREALANMSDTEKTELEPLMQAQPAVDSPAEAVVNRPFVKNWTLEELVPLVDKGLKGRDYDRGHALFAATRCFACHRFADEGGGLGPDLSGVAGRFSMRDLLESIVLPSKVISDQYEAVTIVTTDGRSITGRIVNLSGEDLMLNPDMFDPNKMARVKRDEIEEMKRSPLSMMPEGLLNTLNADEIQDLMAYLLSRGDRQSAMFGGR